MKINAKEIRSRILFLEQLKKSIKSDSISEAYKFTKKLVDNILKSINSDKTLILPDEEDLKNKMVNEIIYYYSINMSIPESLVIKQSDTVKNNSKFDNPFVEINVENILNETKIDEEKVKFKHINEYHINKAIDQAITYINFKNNSNEDFRFVETKLEELVRNSVYNCFNENKNNMEDLYNFYLDIIKKRNSEFINFLEQEKQFEFPNSSYFHAPQDSDLISSNNYFHTPQSSDLLDEDNKIK